MSSSAGFNWLKALWGTNYPLDRDYIENAMEGTPKVLEHCVLAIYAGQTADEQALDATVEDNGVGFNAYDAKYGSYLANYMLNSIARGYAPRLTGKHRTNAKGMMKKYSGQIVRMLRPEPKTETVKLGDTGEVTDTFIPFNEPEKVTARPTPVVTPMSDPEFNADTMSARFFYLELD